MSKQSSKKRPSTPPLSQDGKPFLIFPLLLQLPTKYLNFCDPKKKTFHIYKFSRMIVRNNFRELLKKLLFYYYKKEIPAKSK